MKRKLPFKCKVYEGSVELANRFTGGRVTVPGDAAALYDSIMNAELFRDFKTMRKCLDWFIDNEPDAYMVLLD